MYAPRSRPLVLLGTLVGVAVKVRVVLGMLDEQVVDATVHVVRALPVGLQSRLVITPGRRPVIEIVGPVFSARDNREYLLSQAYRLALQRADDCGAAILALPTQLAWAGWPMEAVTRIAMTVLSSTPTVVREAFIVVPTVAALEIWSETLMRWSSH